MNVGDKVRTKIMLSEDLDVKKRRWMKRINRRGIITYINLYGNGKQFVFVHFPFQKEKYSWGFDESEIELKELK